MQLLQVDAQSDKWTIMVYLDGDCNLEEAGIDDINEMEVIGSTDDVNIIVQFDRIEDYDATNGNWTDTRRFRIIQDENTSLISSPALDMPGELNMGAAETLTDFISWTTTNFPADHYALILWNHGGGWYKSGKEIDDEKGDPPTPEKDVCYDDTSNDYLTNIEVSDAIEASGIHLDILSYDACLMGMIEVAYQSRELADIIISSEDLVPWDGYEYTAFLDDLTQDADMTANELSASIIEAYGLEYLNNATLSAMSSTGVVKIAEMLDSLTLAIIEHDGVWGDVSLAWNEAQRFSDSPEYVDLGSWAKEFGSLVTGELRDHADNVYKAVEDAQVAIFECAAYPEATGLTFYFPEELFYNPNYDDPGRDFSDSTNWETFLGTFFNEFFLDLTEPNNHFATATAAEVWSSNKGQLLDTNDVDIYRIYYTGELVNPGSISLEPTFDIDMQLYQVIDTNLIPILSSQNPGTASESLSFEELDTGYYFILLHSGEGSEDSYTLEYDNLESCSSYDYEFGTPLTLCFDDGSPEFSFTGTEDKPGMGTSFLISGAVDGVWYYVDQLNDPVNEGIVKLELFYADYSAPLLSYTPLSLEPEATGWNYLDLSGEALSFFNENIVFGFSWEGVNDMSFGLDSLSTLGKTWVLSDTTIWNPTNDSLSLFTRVVSYIPEPVPNICYCENMAELTDSSSTITDGSGIQSYGNDCRCKWLIKPEGADRVILTIENLNLEAGYDYLYVYDGESAVPSNLLGRFDGIVLDSTLVAESGTMLLRFVTDGSVTYPGFIASYVTEFFDDLNTLQSNTSWKLYPNPGNGKFTLQSEIVYETEVNLSLFNAMGEMLEQYTWFSDQDNMQLDLSDYPAGLYYIRLNEESETIVLPYIKE